MITLTISEKVALDRLLLHARQPSATGKKCTDFLLACYYPGGIDTTDIMSVWNVTDHLSSDMVTVLISASRFMQDEHYADNHYDALQQIAKLKQ